MTPPIIQLASNHHHVSIRSNLDSSVEFGPQTCGPLPLLADFGAMAIGARPLLRSSGRKWKQRNCPKHTPWLRPRKTLYKTAKEASAGKEASASAAQPPWREAKDAELLASEWSKDAAMRYLLAFSQFQEDLMKAHPDLVKEHPAWFEHCAPLEPRPPPGPPPNWLGSPPTPRPAVGGSLGKGGTLLA